MPARNRPLAAVISLMGALISMLILAASASAAPYSNQPTTTLSTQTPVAGGSFTLSGSGFGANEDVSNTLHSATYALASARTNASGDFSVVVTLPSGITGTHTIVSTGMTSGVTTSITITILAPSSSSSGGLASTGVAVLGIGGFGGLLLVVGGLMLLAGMRRKVDA